MGTDSPSKHMTPPAEKKAMEAAFAAFRKRANNPAFPPALEDAIAAYTSSFSSDGEVDEIRARHKDYEERPFFTSADFANRAITQTHADRATLLARLTALEAENAALKAQLTDYEESYKQHQANILRLDVALNGTDAAKAPLLIDVLGQVEELARKHGPVLSACAALKAEVAEVRRNTIKADDLKSIDTLLADFHFMPNSPLRMKIKRALASQGET